MKEINKNKKNSKANGNKNFIIICAVLLIAAASFIIFNNNKDKSVGQAAEEQNKMPVVTKGDLIINAKDITEKAKFYPYQAGDTYMEVMAVKASDGTVRTALNTCQVCFDSGRGYYKQEGDKIVCQNCGNVFGVDDIEKVKGGCNPVPILTENKKIDGDNIAVSEQSLNENKEFFAKWKRD